MADAPEIRAMDGIELAIRRVSDRCKNSVPWDMGLTHALDDLADEISKISAGARKVVHQQLGRKE